MSLEEDVLADIRPTPSEHQAVHEAARALMERLGALAQAEKIPAEPLLVGSVARDTFLKEAEIDVFVAFPPETSREDLERWGLRLGSVLDEPTRRYAEHPYTRGRFQGYEAEVVPCYKLDAATDRMSAVDRTPFHLVYVQAHLERHDDVRLLKQFMNGIGTYGAEAAIRGFSGYLCELLVLRFGGFLEVLEAVHQWQPPIRLHLGEEASRDFDEPLAFVDPVDPGRNAASAVSIESLSTFILAAHAYAEAPSRTFFFPPPPRTWKAKELVKALRERGTAVYLLTAAAPDLSEDVLFPQLRKADQAIRSFLATQDFRILRSEPTLQPKAWLLLLELEVARLPPVRKHRGPPTWLKNAPDFQRKWETDADRVAGPYVEDNRLVVEVKRKHVEAGKALEEAIPTLSLGKNLDESVQGGFQVLPGEAIVEAGYLAPLSQFLTRELPWLRK